jgi:hypothetical protein
MAFDCSVLYTDDHREITKTYILQYLHDTLFIGHNTVY